MHEISAKRDHNFDAVYSFCRIFDINRKEKKKNIKQLIMPRSYVNEAHVTIPLLVVASLPAFITGTGDKMDASSPLQNNHEAVSGGANDTILNNINITESLDGVKKVLRDLGETDEHDDRLPKEVDHFFLLIMSIIIFFMQCGFAFMEAGAVR